MLKLLDDLQDDVIPQAAGQASPVLQNLVQSSFQGLRARSLPQDPLMALQNRTCMLAPASKRAQHTCDLSPRHVHAPLYAASDAVLVSQSLCCFSQSQTSHADALGSRGARLSVVLVPHTSTRCAPQIRAAASALHLSETNRCREHSP